MSKPRAKLTPKELEEKKAYDQFNYSRNRVYGQWAQKRIVTFRDLLNNWGYPILNYRDIELNIKVNLEDVNNFISDRKIELDTFFWLEKNPPIIEEDDSSSMMTTYNLDNLNAAAERDKERKIKEASIPRPDYTIPNSPITKAFLFWFQKKAVKEIFEKQFGEENYELILKNPSLIATLPIKKKALMVIAATGTGKTFIVGAWLSILHYYNYIQNKTFTPWPIIYVTKASVVEQTKRVLETQFGLTEEAVLVINIDQLRSKFGQLFVKPKITVEDGIYKCIWLWRPNVYPVIIVWDECQALKNRDSQQSEIAQSYNNIDSDNIFQLFVSATPFIRVIESMCFVVATKIPYSWGVLKNVPMCNEHFNEFARSIASNNGTNDTKPEENSPAAINRLMDYMDEYVIRVKGVRPQFHAINRILLMTFETKEGREEYETSWEKFQKEKNDLENNEGMSAAEIRFNILAQLTIFLKAAESNIDRINIICRNMHNSVLEGFASCCAVRNKITIVKCVLKLVYEYGVPRDKISLIWGGAPKGNKKQKNKLKIKQSEELLKKLEEEGLTFEDLDLDDVDETEIQKYPPELRLDAQNPKQRQEEIDRFQRGDSLYCFYTFRAGGVGLSLHHTDEFTVQKVRHKESGYAYEEDIPNIPTRPRRNFVSPTWSAIELVQGVGRCPRLTSLSNTEQTMMFFAGTVEERQARVVGLKLHCLTKVVRNKGESWEDLILGRKGMTADEVEQDLSKDKEPEVDLENGQTKTEGVYTEEEENEHTN